MTERKPAGMDFTTWIDAQIREAQERGEFENLAGKGKPIKGLDGPHDELWWVKQLMAREGLSYLPPALALRREAEAILDSIGQLPSERAVRSVIEELNVRVRDANRKPPLDGPPSTLMPLDVEAVVARWRAEREAHAAEAPAAADAAGVVPNVSRAAPVRRRRWFRRSA